MKKYKTVFCVLTSCLLTVGFADCHSSAVYAEYNLKACPSLEIAWPSEIKTDVIQASKVPPRDPSDWRSCEKMIRYHVKNKVDQHVGLSKIEWTEYDMYLMLQKGSSCKMVVTWPWIGLAPSRTELDETIKKIRVGNTPILELLLKNKEFEVIYPATKVDLLDGSNSYKKYCEQLSGS
jgi:hypothetical protein